MVAQHKKNHDHQQTPFFPCVSLESLFLPVPLSSSQQLLVKTNELSVVVLMRIGRDVVVGGGRESGDGKEEELEDEGKEEGLSSAESSDDEEDYTSEEEEVEDDQEGVGSGDDLSDLLLHSICFHDTPPPELHSMSPHTPTPPPLSLNPKNCSRLATVSWRSHTSFDLVLWCLSAWPSIPMIPIPLCFYIFIYVCEHAGPVLLY